LTVAPRRTAAGGCGNNGDSHNYRPPKLQQVKNTAERKITVKKNMGNGMITPTENGGSRREENSESEEEEEEKDGGNYCHNNQDFVDLDDNDSSSYSWSPQDYDFNGAASSATAGVI
jgi:hypothetical protein